MTSQSADPVLVHATAVARHGAAVLLMGPSGSGKSDLALRLLAQTASPSLPTGDFELVSDDHVLLHRDHDLVIASAPPSIAGKLEVRGIGIADVAPGAPARVALVIELVDRGAVSRLPDRAEIALAGANLPLLRLSSHDGSTPIKVALALDGTIRGNLWSDVGEE